MNRKSSYINEYMKEKYKMVKIYFPNKEIKDRVFTYVKKDLRASSFREYVLRVLRNTQTLPKKTAKKAENVAYSLIMKPEMYEQLSDTVTKNGMKFSSYILACIEDDMRKHGWSLNDKDDRYLLFYREDEQEKSIKAPSREYIDTLLEELENNEKVSNILLVDTKECRREQIKN